MTVLPEANRAAHTAHVIYGDITPVFLRDGLLDRSLFLDPHLTPPDPPLQPTAQGQVKAVANP